MQLAVRRGHGIKAVDTAGRALDQAGHAWLLRILPGTGFSGAGVVRNLFR
ncbi:Putative uncharacterized protein [Halomonas sp. R57-5]|nr:Putative uncharacterized protein [Halomonas sp. R57-5]